TERWIAVVLVAAGESPPAVDRTQPDTRRKIWHASRAGRILVDNRQEHDLMIRSTLRAAFRQLQQDAGYAIAFILTLGLGIGASTAIFSAVEGVLIRPLPSPHADRIVYMQQKLPAPGDASTAFSFVEAAE